MKAFIIKHYGKRGNVTFADIPRPVPKPDQILVQVHAAALNPIDYMIAKGAFKPILKFQLPATLGSDLAGVVVDVGSRVTRFKPGDAVFASIFDLGTGALAEFAVVPENAAALKPVNLDFVQAASIPMVGLNVMASAQGASQPQARTESVHTCRLRRYRHVCDPAGQASWSEGRNDDQHRKHRSGTQPPRRRSG
jgi:NADPH:quinone reductase-like Zn-dependent oxidoreductase